MAMVIRTFISAVVLYLLFLASGQVYGQSMSTASMTASARVVDEPVKFEVTSHEQIDRHASEDSISFGRLKLPDWRNDAVFFRYSAQVVLFDIEGRKSTYSIRSTKLNISDTKEAYELSGVREKEKETKEEKSGQITLTLAYN